MTTTEPEISTAEAVETFHEQIDRIEEAISRCDDLIGKIAEALTKEVRTRRLVIVDENGDERIVTNTTRTATELTVSCPTAPDLTTGFVVASESAETNYACAFAGTSNQILATLEAAVDRDMFTPDSEAYGLVSVCGDLAREGEQARLGLDGLRIATRPKRNRHAR